MSFSPDIELITGFQLHQHVIQEAVLCAEQYIWIATANLKDMHIQMGRGFKPILEAFDRMAGRGVSFRIVHSDLPSLPFRATLERYNRLTSGALELQICQRCPRGSCADGIVPKRGEASLEIVESARMLYKRLLHCPGPRLHQVRTDFEHARGNTSKHQE